MAGSASAKLIVMAVMSLPSKFLTLFIMSAEICSLNEFRKIRNITVVSIMIPDLVFLSLCAYKFFAMIGRSLCRPRMQQQLLVRIFANKIEIRGRLNLAIWIIPIVRQTKMIVFQKYTSASEPEMSAAGIKTKKIRPKVVPRMPSMSYVILKPNLSCSVLIFTVKSSVFLLKVLSASRSSKLTVLASGARVAIIGSKIATQSPTMMAPWLKGNENLN